MAHHPTTVNLDETFVFTANAKKKIFMTIGLGIVLLILGIVFSMMGGHHGHEEAATAHSAEAHHETAAWVVRLAKNLWHNNIFFAGISVMGVFFVAFNYVAWAGWSSSIIRVPAAFGNYLWIAAPLTILLFIVFGHDLFHWTHEYLYDKNSPQYDHVLDHKKGYLNSTFFLIRSAVYFGLWLVFFHIIRGHMKNEDITGDEKWYHKIVIVSAGFLVIFGVTSSMSAWDWAMSVDPHWFSTMFGWYCFASWFISALAILTFIVLVLKDNGYLAIVNENHIHDLGKFVFAFSIFWTYIWFEQFLLYYYANLPEEVGYFITRLKTDAYTPLFFLILVMNFVFPFLILMTRNAKRQSIILKVICGVVVVGHWLDFYMMLTPPIMKQQGGLDGITLFMELGMGLVFLGIFLFMVLTALSKLALIPKNHPMIQESVHHHVF